MPCRDNPGSCMLDGWPKLWPMWDERGESGGCSTEPRSVPVAFRSESRAGPLTVLLPRGRGQCSRPPSWLLEPGGVRPQAHAAAQCATCRPNDVELTDVAITYE